MENLLFSLLNEEERSDRQEYGCSLAHFEKIYPHKLPVTARARKN